jgi:hypothetical protein
MPLDRVWPALCETKEKIAGLAEVVRLLLKSACDSDRTRENYLTALFEAKSRAGESRECCDTVKALRLAQEYTDGDGQTPPVLGGTI